MGLIPYHAVDLPRRDGVVVAYQQGGTPTLTECPYEVVWHGASHRQGSDAATSERRLVMRSSWRDCNRSSLEYLVAQHLHTAGPSTVKVIAGAVATDRLQVREALKRLRLKGYAEATRAGGFGGANTWRLAR